MEMIGTCIICGTVHSRFSTRLNRLSEFCCQKCYEQGKKRHEYNQMKAVKAAKSARSKLPQSKAASRARSKEYYQCPVHRAKNREYQQREDVRVRKAVQARARYLKNKALKASE